MPQLLAGSAGGLLVCCGVLVGAVLMKKKQRRQNILVVPDSQGYDMAHVDVVPTGIVIDEGYNERPAPPTMSNAKAMQRSRF